MKRREFLAAAAAAPIAAAPAVHARPRVTSPEAPFKLAYAPHAGMFRHLAGDDVVDQIAFAHDQGFWAWEDNQMKNRPVAEQERIAKALADRSMTMGVFVANFGTAFGKKSFSTASDEFVQNFLADLESSVECAARVNAKWMTIVLGDLEPLLELDYQHANAIEMLKRGAAIFEPHDLVMVMEPLNPFANHPGMLLSKIPQAYMLCKAVGSPAVKILFDIYHQQITEGNLIPNIRKSWDETAYYQIGDNPGRNEPDSGEINYRNVFKEIHSRGFTGVLGMEHGLSRGGEEGERVLLEAYRAADDF